MPPKKSTQSKVKTRKEAYKRQVIRLSACRSWRILILIMKAVQIFLRSRRDSAIAARLPPSFGVLDEDLIPSNCVGVISDDIKILFPDLPDTKRQFEDFDIIQDVIKKLVSKVCRLDQERQRQLKNRKRNQLSDSINLNELSNSKSFRQCIWFKRKYSQNTSFREQHRKRITKHFQNKYQNNENFRQKQKARIKTHILKKYCNNSRFCNEYKARAITFKDEKSSWLILIRK